MLRGSLFARPLRCTLRLAAPPLRSACPKGFHVTKFSLSYLIYKMFVMKTRIKKGATKEEIGKALETISKRDKFNPDRFVGKIKFEDFPLILQKKMRDEW